MADENIVRSYRSIGPARRPSDPMPARDVGARDAGAGDEVPRSDPLAELARLIGQSDPFADPAPAAPRSRAPSPSQSRPDPAPASDWRATAAALAREAMRRPPMDDPPHDPSYEDGDPQVDRINSAIAAIDSYRTGSDPYYDEPQHSAFDEEQHAESHYAEAQYHDDYHGDHHDINGEGPYAEAAEVEPHEGHEDPNYFFDGEVPPPDPDQRFYDDPPRARRGNGLVTAAVLVGCALLGTAGAYGYRSFYAGTRTTDAPIISADPTPSKMVPAATASVDPAKAVQGDKPPDERIVTHAEEPVTLGAPSPAPRVVLPAPFAPAPSAKPPASTSASSSSAPAPANGVPEPKKVRTVTIKPDSSDAAMRPLTTASTPPSQATLPAPPAPARPAPAAKPAPQPRGNGGPLSLEPRAQGNEPAPPAPAERSPKLASVSGAASGGWSVQVSSQRSEGEAQASFRSLQAKYPRELGDRDAFVQRADLGEKGIYYRTMVGPFGSKADADQFCKSLQTAGGQCNIHRN
jgi:hypothetical protein